MGDAGHADSHSGFGAALNRIGGKLNRFLDMVDGGAVGDGVTDSTAALQNCLDTGRKLPAGVYKTTAPLVLSGIDIHLSGAGQSRTKIVNTVSDVFTGNVDRLRISDVTIHASGGHIFHFTRSSRSRFCDATLIQLNTDKSVLRHDGATGDFIGNTFEHCFIQAKATHTVPVFDLVSRGNVNANTWRDLTCLYSGNYVFSIEDHSGNWAYDNRFQDIVYEVCSGGSIRLLGCNHGIIDNCHEYDSPTYTRDLIYIGQGSGLPSRNIHIRDCGRRGGSLPDEVFDININQCQTAIIELCGAIPDNTYKLKANPSYPRIVWLNDYQKGTVIPT